AVRGPAQDHVAEADGFAGMPAQVAVDAPAEPVGFDIGLAIHWLLRRECGLAPARVEQAVVVERRIPFREIVDRRMDAAVAEHGAGAALVRALPASVDPAVP